MLEPTYSTRATDTRILFYARQVVPEYFQTFWLARRSFLEKNGDVMRRFLRARRKGLDHTLKNIQDAAAIYAKLNKLSDEVGLKVLQASGVPQGDYHSDGRLSPKGLQAVEEAMAISGDIAKEFRIPWKEIVDQSYLDPDQRISLPA
jgi:ABC-type nitrate/sulfonate/bicarbonate transport system substrate-binding protein